jgi:hypothetical protein
MGWILLLLALWLVQVQAMKESQLRELRYVNNNSLLIVWSYC